MRGILHAGLQLRAWPHEHERESQRGFEWGALRSLAPHLWPASNPSIRLRVVGALALLTAAKLATVYVPILFKRMVDLFSDPQHLPVALPLG